MTITKEQAQTALQDLLRHMNVSAEVLVTDTEERISLEIKGEESALLIGKKGQTLDALQYMVNKIVCKGLPEGERTRPVQVDTEGYRSRRAETLTDLAHSLAEKVRGTGRPVELDPMTAMDRRIVHMALAESEGVETRSEGEGIYRHLVIFPKQSPRSP